MRWFGEGVARFACIAACAALPACGSSSVLSVTDHRSVAVGPDAAALDAAATLIVPVAATAECPTNDSGATTLGTFDAAVGENESIAAIAADDEALYVVVDTSPLAMSATPTTTTVYRIPACGGPLLRLGAVTLPPPAVDPFGGGASAALVASNRVFVTMSDGIYSLPTTGGAMVLEVAVGTGGLVFVAAYGDELYWTDRTPTLWSVKTGGGHTVTAITNGAPMTWGSLALDSTSAYVTAVLPADGGKGVDYVNGSVLTISLSDGTISTLASGIYEPGNIVVAGATVYWTSDRFAWAGSNLTGTGSIQSVSIQGGPVTTVVSDDSPPPGAFMVLGNMIYWIDVGMSGGVSTVEPSAVRVLRPGGMPATVPITLPPVADPVILAPSGMYWSASNGTGYGRFAL